MSPKPYLNLYCHQGTMELSQAPCGTEKQRIFHDLKTIRGARKRLDALGWESYRIYYFSNIYEEKTFKLCSEKNFIPKQTITSFKI